jgi:hypothetical protein
MKTHNYLKSLLLFLLFLGSCTNDQTITNQTYIFTKPYCATVTVGGVVGLAEKCYKIGDVVSGKENTSGKITIRITGHFNLNDGPNSSQEFLDVPINYLELTK